MSHDVQRLLCCAEYPEKLLFHLVSVFTSKTAGLFETLQDENDHRVFFSTCARLIVPCQHQWLRVPTCVVSTEVAVAIAKGLFKATGIRIHLPIHWSPQTVSRST